MSKIKPSNPFRKKITDNDADVSIFKNNLIDKNADKKSIKQSKRGEV